MSWSPLLLSFQVALLSTLLAVGLGILVAGLLAFGRWRGREVLDVLITAPMVLPPTVLGYYLLLMLGRRSFLGRVWESSFGSPIVFTKTAAVVAATVAAFPFVVKSTRAAMEDVDPRLLAAASTLGASPLRVFWTVVLPLSRNGLMAGTTLGFARALGDFGVTLMLAGNIPGLTQTGSLAIYDAVQANRETEATGMVLMLTAFALAALGLGNKMARRRPHAF